jgi:hypothetical protein
MLTHTSYIQPPQVQKQLPTKLIETGYYTGMDGFKKFTYRVSAEKLEETARKV